MTAAVEAQPSSARRVGDKPRTRGLLGASAVALAAQVAVTDYGTNPAGTNPAEVASFWFAFGCLLLWLIYRKRSRMARGFVVMTSAVGAIGYGLGALGGDAHAAFLSLTFLAEAAPLMTKNIRSHVQARA
ncbi:hypothetical protein [Pimelobacter simplex]|uniref:hypothetical protein n=1 Tax=Nocardioides simplex TaxID=2045 RepID=UPI001933260D|nr:hypothetical protein [Pimelobacter simplex]